MAGINTWGLIIDLLPMTFPSLDII